MSIGDYIRDTRAEMKHVIWPTRSQTIAYALAVVVISIVTALILGAGDTVFTFILKHLIGA